ncbi:hypothetical protein [Streptomyces chartreusis]|uniref:hypothetical protein n=1 Tax=Streptomyces chartreusis TaxID=1969 RepID=UPI003410C3B2
MESCSRSKKSNAIRSSRNATESEQSDLYETVQYAPVDHPENLRSEEAQNSGRKVKRVRFGHDKNRPIETPGLNGAKLAEIWQEDINLIDKENARILKGTPLGGRAPLLLLRDYNIVIIGEDNLYYDTAKQLFEGAYGRSQNSQAVKIILGQLRIIKSNRGSKPGEIYIYGIDEEYESSISAAVYGRATRMRITYK